jgi:two-component system LytT family sensor kinase
MGTALKTRLLRISGLFVLWTTLGLFLFSQGIVQKIFSGDKTPWTHHLTGWLAGTWLWFLLTPCVLWLGRRFPIQRGHLAGRIPLHLLFAVLFAIGELATEAVILRSLHVFPMFMTSVGAAFLFLMIIGFHQGVLTYWMILGVQYAHGWYVRYQERKQEALRLELRSSELQKQLVQAHLGALKMQLQPHFLFNTLNAIMVLVRQQKSHEAEETLARLSDLLRCVLDDVEAQEVPLRRELEYLQLYLSIEQVRFQDRLRVEIAADPQVLEAAVPHMVLQPLVENAIRHGIGKSSSAGRLRISACRVQDVLELRVEDDGPGLTASNGGPTRGIGLANTRARLERLYGAAAHLTIENAGKGGVVAAIVMPCRLLEPDAEDEALEAHGVHDVTG